VGLGLPGGLTGLHGPCCSDGVDDVGLAVAATDLPVRSGDLDDLDVLLAQEAGQCGAVATGALDPYRAKVPEAAQPTVELPVAAQDRGERLRSQDPAEVVKGRRDVLVLVGVDAAGDDDLC